ncbi:MAG: hypothetical protein HRT63_09000 [Erythrobacter sp.]|nr:hypothetical protein [Erythrobacter sp.]
MANEGPSTLFFETVKPFRLRISFTYGLTLMENVFELLYPFTIGLAINGLISGQGWQSLAPFIIIWLLHITSATARQMYDTRLFAKIYGAVAEKMILRQTAAGVSTSEIAARAVMIREAIDFFEFEIPQLLTALITMFGGVAMLYYYDALSGIVMSLLLGPISWLYFRFGKKSLRLSERLNNRHEKEVHAIVDARQHRVAYHFKALAKWRVRLSDTQARTWATADLLMIVAVIVVLLRLTSEPGVQAGDVFAGVSYILSVIWALDEGPVLVEQLSRLVDIRRRIDEIPEAED